MLGMAKSEECGCTGQRMLCSVMHGKAQGLPDFKIKAFDLLIKIY